MRDSDTFNAHAVRCGQEAFDATLDNVRDRALRAQAAWTAMAGRSLKIEAARGSRSARPIEDVAPEVFG